METIRYKKLRSGDWGLIGHGLVEGQLVTVFKSRGGVETETVGPVVWAKDGLAITKIAGRVARGPRGKGTGDHFFTAPRTDPYNGDPIDYSEENYGRGDD